MKKLILAFALALAVSPALAFREAPTKLTDAEFWKLSADLSEPGGYFQSDNILSNELGFQTIIPDLAKIVKPGVYMGVGPEQNFTYIAALKPKMAIITDIRRGNLQLHLMYKALFEMAADRADFVGLLFSKKRPEGLTAAAPIDEIFTKYGAVPTTEAVYNETWKRMIDHLTKAPHTLPLDKSDIDGIKFVFDHFYSYGPSITYSSATGGGGRNMANYEQLMRTNDGTGQQRSYLATDEAFKFMQDLESKNLLVPVVGNFAGPSAIRAVGSYIRERGETVMAFYLSNVEDYLPMGGTWERFCNSVSSLPLTETSTFIYGARPSGGFPGGGLASYYRNIQADVKAYNCKP
ncbi:MAG: hypothetical protein EPO35_11485 [Acidobacteria bacterium]|nr:MAG: hypothetical protein EPO35_11485 [Acidobacteriota bacterium]